MPRETAIRTTGWRGRVVKVLLSSKGSFVLMCATFLALGAVFVAFGFPYADVPLGSRIAIVTVGCVAAIIAVRRQTS